MKIALHWFRCDLRLNDNTALHAACEASDVVVPIFIFDPVILKAKDTGAPIVGFMLGCLAELQREIELSGAKLTFRHGEVESEMRDLIQKTGATALYFNRDYEPYARERDGAVEKMVKSLGVEVHSFKDGVIHEGAEIGKEDGTPYRVFTPYSKAWRARERPEVLPQVKLHWPPRFKPPPGVPLPTAKKLGFSVEIKLPPTGEAEGRKHLEAFVQEDLLHYASRRNFPALGGTSRLSPHIRIGTLSPRTILAAADAAVKKHPEAKKEAETYESELIWRDFYRQIMWHFPHVITSSFKKEYNELKWENNERYFKAWCEGRTGFPMVDAGMRQLNSVGWMHNRLRMIVAAFLTKDLLVSWQWGESYFLQKLMDADLSSNNGGWQWSASTGTDAQPFFRIFNPQAQAEKFDPEGIFIHQFVPEIDTADYPAPIVDHAVQRPKALALFKQ